MTRRIAAAAVAALVAIALSLVGATAASAATTVTVSVPSTVLTGSSATAKVTVSGSYSGAASLQVKSGSTWSSARTFTITKGKGSTSVKPPSARTYRIKVGKNYSAAFTVKPVAAMFTASLAKSTIFKGGSTTATLTYKPSASGTASLQVKSGSTWTTASTFPVTGGAGTATLKPSATRTYRAVMNGFASGSFTVTVKPVPTSFTFAGAGWGHGVGMSQYGAYGMALDGATAGSILKHYYTGTKVETLPAAGDIRVQVFGNDPSDSSTTANLTVRSPGSGTDHNGQWRLQFYASASDTTPATTWTGYNDEKLTATRGATSVAVKRADGTTATGVKVILQWEATSNFMPTSPEDAVVEVTTASGAVATNGTYRHGQLELSVISSRLVIVNTLKLNTEYLYGVAEMPSSWALKALEAQVIAARGYAVRNVAAGVKASCDCNVYDDSSSQNFTGWKKESEGTAAVYGKKWVSAVDLTNSPDGLSGMVLTYGTGGAGKIATTYYFSSSGGQTENSEDVWSSAVSYLRSVSDAGSLDSRVRNPNAAWTATITQSNVAADFGLPNVVSIAITQRTSSSSKSAVYVLTATSTTGAKATLTKADVVRTSLGLKSPWIWSIKAN